MTIAAAPASVPAAVGHRLCIAPMLDWSTRHFRYFARLLTRRARVYTEMLTTGAVLHGDPARLLRFDPLEHPVALQLGGSDPIALGRAARLGAEFGYDEINLNCGCPSDRVQSGRFGACLMIEPELVGDCVRAMREAVAIPVTVKTRLGIDQHDDYAFLVRFVAAVRDAGCRVVILHARKAWLQGLSPKQNREIPPLMYDRVYAIKRDFPDLEIVLNGGIRTIAQAHTVLDHVDGVMIGREVQENPFILAAVDARVFGVPPPPPTRTAVLQAYLPYARAEHAAGTPMSALTRHLLGLFHGQPGARSWRRALSEQAHRPNASPAIIEHALAECLSRAALLEQA